ncbi:hypothetical protein [Pseudoalteromonas nigrifaciens]|uniref:hypothetical protein n=1 Tax=Pseudoalteromonas nigrifaciens TaxID=28109 RepID=UPI001787E708|nr:hypothetical protein [Pseudoalteromonas nigrifaciens]MBE0421692.1 hypothetical protein [Pseudoalteromonas nigrifaciens]
MRELNVKEIQKVNGGIAPIIWFAGGVILRKQGANLIGGAIGGIIGWASEP